MPLNRATIIRSLLLLVALGSSCTEGMFCGMLLGFSGAPADFATRVALIIGMLLWIPVLVSYRAPRTGFTLFIAMLGAQDLLYPPHAGRERLDLFIPAIIAGIFLTLYLLTNLMRYDRD